MRREGGLDNTTRQSLKIWESGYSVVIRPTDVDRSLRSVGLPIWEVQSVDLQSTRPFDRRSRSVKRMKMLLLIDTAPFYLATIA